MIRIQKPQLPKKPNRKYANTYAHPQEFVRLLLKNKMDIRDIISDIIYTFIEEQI